MSNDNTPGLPLWARLSLLFVLLAVLIYNVATQGDATLSLVIAGGVLGAIGLDQNARNKGA